jgi:hypothetical protein
MIFNNSEKIKSIELIGRILSGQGGTNDLKALERITGNKDVWVMFDVLELDGMSAEQVFNVFFSEEEVLEYAH